MHYYLLSTCKDKPQPTIVLNFNRYVSHVLVVIDAHAMQLALTKHTLANTSAIKIFHKIHNHFQGENTAPYMGYISNS